jgi:probable F420-dependent oxidoreductase
VTAVTSLARSRSLGVALPYWFDRPDLEALDVAAQAARCPVDTVWIGEMTSFDAFALATAIGLQRQHRHLKIGPLAIGVRSPVSLALGTASVAALTGARVDLALGVSSPLIVAGWHARSFDHPAARMAATVPRVRDLLSGRRQPGGGFRLRQSAQSATISVAAFGPRMTRVAAALADEVVLNLVTPEHVAAVRRELDAGAPGAGRPTLAVWVTTAVDPDASTAHQITAQLAAYLAPPGYGEMFVQLGYEDLVAKARAGVHRRDLVAATPIELAATVGAIGSESHVLARLAAYYAAGADHVAVVPATARDTGGSQLFDLLRRRGPELLEPGKRTDVCA